MTTQNNAPATGAKEVMTQEFNGKPVTATVFGYQRPEKLEKGKGIVRLCRSDIVYSTVQVLQDGGENNMHAHPAQDGIWIVLKGRVKFYHEQLVGGGVRNSEAIKLLKVASS